MFGKNLAEFVENLLSPNAGNRGNRNSRREQRVGPTSLGTGGGRSSVNPRYRESKGGTNSGKMEQVDIDGDEAKNVVNNKRRSVEIDEEEEKIAEEYVKKEQPELHHIMSSFKRLAVDPKSGEIPQLKVPLPPSVGRLLQHRPSALPQDFSEFTRERSMSTYLAQQGVQLQQMYARDESSEVLVDGPVKKLQPGSRDWLSRHLVLRKSGLFYYDNEDSFLAELAPRGKIFFFDIVRPNGAAADLVPINLFTLLGKQNVFQVHTEKRTHAFAALNGDDQRMWAEAINKNYDNYLHDQESHNGVLEKAWMLGEESSWKYFADLVAQEKDLEEIVDSVNEKFLEDLGEQITYLTNTRELRKCFEAWLVYHRLKKRAKRIKNKQQAIDAEKNGVVSIAEGVGVVLKSLEKLMPGNKG